MPPLAESVQPAYAAPCVPPGQVVVVIESAPPLDVTATCAVAVTAPAALVAVNVYVVVALGVTVVEPLATAEVNVPGVIAILVAPVDIQFNVLLEPETTLDGEAVNDVMVGLLATLTGMVMVAVVAPAALVAVSVYVVVALGLTVVDPLEEVEVNVPGVIAMLVAPVVAQFSVLLAPCAMLAGLAVKAVIVGLPAALTVTITDAVAEPALLIAVSV